MIIGTYWLVLQSNNNVPIKWETLVLYDIAIQYFCNDGDDGDDNFDVFLWLAEFVFDRYTFISFNCRLYIKLIFSGRCLTLYDITDVDNNLSLGSVVIYNTESAAKSCSRK